MSQTPREPDDGPGPDTAGSDPTEPDSAEDAGAGGGDGSRVVVVTPQGMSVTQTDDNLADLIEQPAKVMRIGSMIKGLLEEVRSAPLDEAGRARLAEVHSRSISELQSGLAPELVEELRRITLPFSEESSPSDAELRVAQAALVGWLEGLFHGIQTALFAQQMAARAQFEEMRRRALPGVPLIPGQTGSGSSGTAADPSQPGSGPGQYL